MNQSGNIQKQNHNSPTSEKETNDLWVPNSLRNAPICLRGGDDIAYELLVLRFASLLNSSGTQVDYMTSHQWLKNTLQSVGIVNRVIDQPDPQINYVMDCTVNELLPLLKKQLDNQFPLPIFLTPELGRSEAFSTQWLKDLPPPYIGISWDLRAETNRNDVSMGIDFQKLIGHVSSLNGTLVILQQNPTKDELDYIGANVNASVLDCSDLYDDPGEMLAVMDLLDDFIGVPDLAQTLRASLHKNAHVCWPFHLLEHNSLWGDNPQDLSQWFPDAKVYCQSSSTGWGNALSALETDLRQCWPFSSDAHQVETADVVESTSHQNTAVDMQSLVRHAAGCVTDQLSSETEHHVQDMIAMFNASRHSVTSKLNIFVYHASMGDAGQLKYNDVNLNLNKFDYRQVLNIFIESVQHWHPEANIYLVSNSESEFLDLGKDNVRVVGLNVEVDKPMYERVNAMCAYVHSLAFDADTLFLDSDAFLNSEFSTALDADFDVAITTRPILELMPVNEGVIVAKKENPESVAHFFRRYLATFDALREDDLVQGYYGDIRKWRGGQLSLNAVSYDASPFSPYRQLNIHNTQVRVLPCDPYNYSWEYGQSVTEKELSEKMVIHVKGARKDALQQLLPLMKKFRSLCQKEQPGFVTPHFAIFNKMFNEPPFVNQEMVKKFAGHVATSAEMIATNKPASGALLADDMFVWFRNLGFLSEPEFVNAFQSYADDALLRARIWRVYMLCWAVKSCLRVEGDFVDLGCYDGRTVHVMARYIDLNQHNKRYFLYDLFENPTDESRKAKHGPNLYAEVCQLFSEYPNATVIKGPVPDSFVQGLPEKIAFAQIDLNEAEPELAALKVIYDRITPGGMIIFDDFGFKRYAESHDKEMAFFRNTGDIVFESPTGQGLFIKRA